MNFSYKIGYYLNNYSNSWVLYAIITLVFISFFLLLIRGILIYIKSRYFDVSNIVNYTIKRIKLVFLAFITISIIDISFFVYKSYTEDFQIKIGNASVIVSNEVKRELSKLNLETISTAYPITSKEQVEVILEAILGKDIEVK